MNDMITKDGIEIKTMIDVEIILSVAWFFFNAAIIPRTKPSGTDVKRATKFKRNE
jgi:hypothetical protein